MGRKISTYKEEDQQDYNMEDALLGTDNSIPDNPQTRQFTLEGIKAFFESQGIIVDFLSNQNTNEGEPPQAKIWIGSEAEYQALVQAGEVQDDTLYYRREA